MAGIGESPKYALHFGSGEVDEGLLAVPFPAEELEGKDAIGLAELVSNAMYRLPRQYPEERKRIAGGFDRLEQQPDTVLEVQGPQDGNFYIVLPDET